MSLLFRILLIAGALTFIGAGLDILTSSECESVDIGGRARSITYQCYSSDEGEFPADPIGGIGLGVGAGLIGLSAWGPLRRAFRARAVEGSGDGLGLAVAPPSPVAPRPIDESDPSSFAAVPRQPGVKTCPWCAEDIKVAAVVCRYCGRDLPVSEVPISHADVSPLLASTLEPTSDTQMSPGLGLLGARLSEQFPDEAPGVLAAAEESQVVQGKAAYRRLEHACSLVRAGTHDATQAVAAANALFW